MATITTTLQHIRVPRDWYIYNGKVVVKGGQDADAVDVRAYYLLKKLSSAEQIKSARIVSRGRRRSQLVVVTKGRGRAGQPVKDLIDEAVRQNDTR